MRSYSVQTWSAITNVSFQKFFFSHECMHTVSRVPSSRGATFKLLLGITHWQCCMWFKRPILHRSIVQQICNEHFYWTQMNALNIEVMIIFLLKKVLLNRATQIITVGFSLHARVLDSSKRHGILQSLFQYGEPCLFPLSAHSTKESTCPLGGKKLRRSFQKSQMKPHPLGLKMTQFSPAYFHRLTMSLRKQLMQITWLSCMKVGQPGCEGQGSR